MTTYGALNWMHRDDRGLSAAMAAGAARAKAGPWLDDAQSTADLRGLLFLTCTAAALCGGSAPTISKTDTSEIKITKSPRLDDQDWQIAFGRALGALSMKQEKAIPAGKVVKIDTANGEPPKAAGDVGFVLNQWAAAFGIVGLAGIAAAYLYYTASQENEIAATKISTDANQQMLASELAAAAEVIAAHKAREQSGGATIAYDDQELAFLNSLNAAIDKTTGWHAPPLKSIPNVTDITKPFGEGLGAAVGSVALVPLALAILILMK